MTDFENWAYMDYRERMEVLEAEINRLREGLRKIQSVVDQQAEDEGLWFKARTAAEGYLQQELRRLHSVIEGGKTK